VLVVMAGLPGAGKSAVAEELARALGCAVLSVDPVEAALWRAGVGKDEPTGPAAYVVAEALAAEQLALGRDVIVDAVNGWRLIISPLAERAAHLAEKGELLGSRGDAHPLKRAIELDVRVEVTRVLVEVQKRLRLQREVTAFPLAQLRQRPQLREQAFKPVKIIFRGVPHATSLTRGRVATQVPALRAPGFAGMPPIKCGNFRLR
jgi:hypothetical protein